MILYQKSKRDKKKEKDQYLIILEGADMCMQALRISETDGCMFETSSRYENRLFDDEVR